MRRSASLLIPLTMILMYYAFWVVAVMYLVRRFPGLDHYLPLGGISDLAGLEHRYVRARVHECRAHLTGTDEPIALACWRHWARRS